MRFLFPCVLLASAAFFVGTLSAAHPACESEAGCVCINYPGAGEIYCTEKSEI